jgi:hypothetical protein
MKTLNVTSESKYLKLYYEWMEYPNHSWFLCHVFGKHDELLNLMSPNDIELDEHAADGYARYAWGSRQGDTKTAQFNELRQNIVLFMAAMNNEL